MHFSLKRKLTFSYLGALGLIAVLTIASYLIIQQSLHNKTSDARVINISGQQASLSQQIAKIILLLENTREPNLFNQSREELFETVQLWEQFHEALQNGDQSLGLPGNNSEEINAFFETLQPDYQAIKAIADSVHRLNPAFDNDHLLKLEELADSLLYHDRNYLATMNKITYQYDQEISKKLETTKSIEFYLLLITLFVLVLEGFFIFQPTIKMTYRYFSEINESKSKLENLNQSLQLSEAENRNKTEELKASEEEIRQKMEELETINENLKKTTHELRQKNEILKDATEVLDLKNNQIRQHRDELLEQSKLLEERNINITNSIRYARRIQEAIIRDPESITQDFKDAFIFFRPRDIVSGDFYWYYKIGETQIIIAADCTGHGVPGALMTMIGNSLLNEIVSSQEEISPSDIIHRLDEKLIETLQKRDNDGRPIHDGMDMAVLAINQSNRTVQFAAAHNPLYYIDPDEGEINRIKGSKFPVGSAQYKLNKVFDLHSLDLKPGTCLYLFSDGFQDQYNVELKRKYMTKRFRNYLLLISHLPMAEQKRRLEEEFEKWQGNSPQTDDVLVIGIRI